MQKFRNIISIVGVLILSACVTTNTSGFVDPDYRDGRFNLKKVVVRVSSPVLEDVAKTENALVKNFTSLGVTALKWTDISPPTRNYNLKQSVALLSKTKADALFSTYIEDVSSVQHYVPPSYTAGTSHSTVNMIGNTAFVNTQTTPGYVTGGYTVSKPTMLTSSSLIDLKNGNTIWTAQGSSGGGVADDYTALLIDAGQSAIKDLQVKGIIRPKVTPIAVPATPPKSNKKK